jgi:hypothetical protein
MPVIHRAVPADACRRGTLGSTGQVATTQHRDGADTATARYGTTRHGDDTTPRGSGARMVYR